MNYMNIIKSTLHIVRLNDDRHLKLIFGGWQTIRDIYHR